MWEDTGMLEVAHTEAREREQWKMGMVEFGILSRSRLAGTTSAKGTQANNHRRREDILLQ